MSFSQRGADVNWQRDKTFLDANLYMLENELATDVTFIVSEASRFPHVTSDLRDGVSNLFHRSAVAPHKEGLSLFGDRSSETCSTSSVEVTVRAHRFVLIARSCVFEAMFCGGMIENGLSRDLPIRVIDVDAEIFKEVLRYIYGDCAEITDDNVLRLWYAARKYLLEHLERVCIEYLRDSLTADNVCNVLEHSLILDSDVLKQQCLRLVAMDTNTIVRSSGFLQVSIAGLEDILSLNAVAATELDIYEACLRWVDGQPDLDDARENENNSDADRCIVEDSTTVGEPEQDVCNEEGEVMRVESYSGETSDAGVSHITSRRELLPETSSPLMLQRQLKCSSKRKITSLESPGVEFCGTVETFECTASKQSRLDAERLSCQGSLQKRSDRVSVVARNVANNRKYGLGSQDSVANDVEPDFIPLFVIPSNSQTALSNAATDSPSTARSGDTGHADSICLRRQGGEPRRIKTESVESENITSFALDTHSRGAKVRSCLGNVFYRIRFPTMKPEIFASHFGQSDVLSGDEKSTIYYHLITRANCATDGTATCNSGLQPGIAHTSGSDESSSTVAPLLFDSSPRRLLVPRTVERFEKLSIDLSDEGANGGRYVGLHAIRFKVDRDVLLSGIGLYSGITKECAPFDVRIRVLKAQRCLALKSAKVDAGHSIAGVVHVSLDRNLYARADIDYTIIVDIAKSHGCRFFGQQGRAICPATEVVLHAGAVETDRGGATFKFSNASLKLPSITNVGEGQIAQLVYISA